MSPIIVGKLTVNQVRTPNGFEISISLPVWGLQQAARELALTLIVRRIQAKVTNNWGYFAN